jgi:MFS superfamily sulfate permease-like transporter
VDAADRSSCARLWHKDVAASLVVFLVALPLCMGIAIASGLPPAAGLITGIVGGLVVGWIAGSPLQVSGPAAGLIVLVHDVAQRYGAETLGVILLLAGLLQVVAGIGRLAPWFRAVSPSVIQGMLAGIGALILLSQIHVMMDLAPHADGLSNLCAIPHTLWLTFNPFGETGHDQAAFLGFLTITVIFAWDLLFKTKSLIPGTLIAVILATVVAFHLRSPVRYVDVSSKLRDAVHAPAPAAWSLLLEAHVWLSALAIALVASAESLLCAAAVDKLHSGPRTQFDRELIAQGVGNTLCGLLGGLPMTGVIVRSSANIHAGARTRLSTMLHGLWLLVLVAFLPGLLRLIPIACLAGILVYTGFKLINLPALRDLWAVSKSELAICSATFCVIVLRDLLTGVVVGVVLSGVKVLFTFARLTITVNHQPHAKRTELRLAGAATFLRLPHLASALENVPVHHELHVRFDDLSYIDHACFDLFTQWAQQHQAQGGRLVLDWHSLHARFRQENVATEPDGAPLRKAS